MGTTLGAAAEADALLDRLVDLGDDAVGARYGRCLLTSAFQPVISITHARVVGYEALLRGVDAEGNELLPRQLLGSALTDEDLGHLDRLASAVHLANFARRGPADCWLFVNIHAGVLGREAGDHPAPDLADQLGLPPSRLVLEILEDDIRDEAGFDAVVTSLRDRGYTIAIDDFGRGYSNVDRILRATPEIVKLDLSIAESCRTSPAMRHACTHLTGMLHDLGALVLAEGIESHDDGVGMAGADVDLLQGYWFGRPNAVLPTTASPVDTSGLLAGVEEGRAHEAMRRDEATTPHQRRLEVAAAALRRGGTPEQAAAIFLDGSPGAERFFLLDANGRGVGAVHSPDRRADSVTVDRLLPLQSRQGNDLSRRRYFRTAVTSPGKVAVSGPYYSFIDGPDRYSVAVAIGSGPETRVVCGSFVLSC